MATCTFIRFFRLSTHCRYANSAKKDSFVRDEAHAHSIMVFRRNLFPCVIRRDLILPALSSLRGLSPTHDTSFFGVWNCSMSAPNSAIMEVALRSFTPGTVWRFPSSFGNHSSQRAVIFFCASSLWRCYISISSTSWLMMSMSVSFTTPVRAFISVSFPCLLIVRPCSCLTRTDASVMPCDMSLTMER